MSYCHHHFCIHNIKNISIVSQNCMPLSELRTMNFQHSHLETNLSMDGPTLISLLEVQNLKGTFNAT